VRAEDSRGRHTTTARELVPLPEGGVLLDTPGIRALELWGASEGLEASFSDIDELAESCKFSDCEHRTEPGCAVLAAVEDGTLDARRFESYQKLQRELRAFELRHDPHQQRRAGREFGRVIRNMEKIDPERWNRR
jgi:ribosome biogenesis GTPase / thiamine phosphate phosphatase